MRCREDEEEEEEEEEGRRGGAWMNSRVPALGRSFPCARAGPAEASSIPGTPEGPPSTEPGVAFLSPTVPHGVLSHHIKHLLCARPRRGLGNVSGNLVSTLGCLPHAIGEKKNKEKANRVTDDNKIIKAGFGGEKSRGASRKSQLWVGRGFVVVSGWDKTEQTEYRGESGARCAGNRAERLGLGC